MLIILDELDPVTKVDLDVYLNDMFSVNGRIRGHGFGELVTNIVKGATFDDRRNHHKRIHKAYLKAYDTQKWEEIYGEEERAMMAQDMACEDAPIMMDEDESKPLIEMAAAMDEPAFAYIQEEEIAAPLAGKNNQPKKVKSKYTAPSA